MLSGVYAGNAGLRVDEMLDSHALVLSTWRYAGDMSLNDRDADDVTYVMDPANGYRAILRGDELVGFCNFGEDARVPGGPYEGTAVDVGIGLAPELVGSGLGHDALAVVLGYAREAFPGASLRATVAVSQRASQAIFERAGFSTTHRFTATSGVTYVQYLLRDHGRRGHEAVTRSWRSHR